MNELENLRPEVREAVVAIDGGNGVFVNSDDGIGSEKWKVVRSELLRLTDDCARLVDCINAQPPTRRSLIDRAERAEAELETAQNTIDAQQDTMGAMKRKLAIAEAELEALKARIRGACLVPLTAVMLRDGYSLTVSGPMSVNDVDELAGKCVRLVVEK